MNHREVLRGACLSAVGFCLCASLLAQDPAAQQPASSPTPPAAPQTATAASSPSSTPLGFAGGGEGIPPGAIVPVPDRWRIGFPEWAKYQRGRPLDPYHQNVLKGDYPLFGQGTFLNVSATSDTIGELRRVPVGSDVSGQRPDNEEFFGKGEQGSFIQEVILTVSLFHGDSAFKPRDWELRVTPVGNFNYLHTNENGIVNIDVREGNTRTDHYIGLQEAFGEVKLFDVSPYYDFVSLRAGIQGFVSDFRGFVFADNNDALRLFGNFASNRYQWNLAFFDQLEKDTNSGLNTLHQRHQHVGIANFYAQDFIWQGYTTQLSVLYNDDDPTRHFDENGFLVRPAPIGDVAQHALHVGYAGWTGEGHIGRLNISHAFYEAYGTDDHNPIAGRRTDVNAQMAALELSVDVDWWRPVLTGFWSSGDKNPTDSKAHGFSAIFDDPKFAGGPFSFWNREAIPLTQTGVKLVQGNSLIPDLRSSKDEGQANYVNPGLQLAGLMFDFRLTPKVEFILNGNYLRFDHTEPLELLLFQPNIDREIGWDYGLGIRWRPDLNQQIQVVVGGAGFTPGRGFKQIYSSVCDSPCGAQSKLLYQAFGSLVFAF